ncbi:MULTISPECIES: hypothetical protein [unclassified Paraburkholderia]|uniref:hypothetical protein n=1 Tax=unclassified Paraburkholderia TaxID=2615204 RepID=UPI002AB00E8D|nr:MULTISPECIES: hypothetical protein [unclassified Paraburkholderia]
MTDWPPSVLFGIPVAGIIVGHILSYFIYRLRRAIALDDARDAMEAKARKKTGVVYAQPTAVPVDAFTRIATTVKAPNLSIRLDGGQYACSPYTSAYAAMHASAS